MKNSILKEIIIEKKKKRLENLVIFSNQIRNIKKKKKDNLYFIYLNNYDYNFIYFIGYMKKIIKQTLVLNLKDIEIQINLMCPNLFSLYKIK